MLDRIRELNQLLVQYRHEYYVLNEPTVSDKEFDLLEKELKGLIAQHPEWSNEAPVLFTVGSDLTDQGGRVKHITPMLSLENCYTQTELLEWAQEIVDRIPDVWFSIEPKLDGGSCELSYLDLKLVKAVTRGNGTYGEDVTQVMAASGAVPLTLKPHNAPTGLIRVRGEVWLPVGRMEALNAEQEKLGKKGWTSPRNLATGTMKLKDLQEIKRRGLRFSPWDCFGIEAEHLAPYHRDIRWKTHTLDYLYRKGFSQPFNRAVPGADLLKGLNRHLTEMQAEREHLWHGVGMGMLTDGLVFKVESQEHRDLLGEGEKYPNWARSYKFSDQVSDTTLDNIEWSISRNGKLTPVGILKPVTLGGAEITRVNLNNITWMQEIGITELPCKVEVLRAGDVIPVITKVYQ